MKRQSNTGIGAIGSILFGLSLLAIWVILDFTTEVEWIAIIPGVLAIAFAAMSIVGCKRDVEGFKANPVQGLRVPLNGFLNTGGIAFALGLIGLMWLLLDGAWGNTPLLIFEIASIVVGLGLLMYGVMLDKKDSQSVDKGGQLGSTGSGQGSGSSEDKPSQQINELEMDRGN